MFDVSDSTIDSAIRPELVDNPDAPTIAEVREALEWLQTDVESSWEELMDLLADEDDYLRIEHEDSDVIVFSFAGSGFPQGRLREGYGGYIDGYVPEIVGDVHQKVAMKKASDTLRGRQPLVVGKTGSIEQGQQYVEAVMNSLLKRGLSPGQAWAYYGVEIRGKSQNQWSKDCGYADHSTTRDAVNKAKTRLLSHRATKE